MSESENGHARAADFLPQKDFFRIGEVSRLTGIKAFVLRYWETEFPSLQPVKSPSGHRLYRREEVQTVLEIRRLPYDEGFTIAGARRHLRDRSIDAASAENAAATGNFENSADATAARAITENAGVELAPAAQAPAVRAVEHNPLPGINRKTLLDLR